LQSPLNDLTMGFFIHRYDQFTMETGLPNETDCIITWCSPESYIYRAAREMEAKGIRIIRTQPIKS
jgi:hypothetical protein